MRSPAFVTPLLKRGTGPWRLRNTRTGDVLATSVRGAFDSATRRLGLLKRDSFPAGEALVIAPTQAVHTFFMKFPIDLVYVRGDGTVVKVVEHLRPWRVSGAVRAYGVIELPAGTLARTPVEVGDGMVLETATSTPDTPG